MNPISRRRFLQSAGPLIVPARVLGLGNQPAPSEKITLGLIGNGGRGEYLINWFLKEADARIVAVCDVDSLHYRDRKWGNGNAHGREAGKAAVDAFYGDTGCAMYSDYRELCARPDIDAVLVATPDHWHALIELDALRHGKDVYGEKPVTHLFSEGRTLCREVEQRKAVFQVGSQQRSEPVFHQAVELVRNGVIGKVRQIEVGLPAGYATPQRDETFAVIEEPPAHLDYEFWCGPSEKLPYMRARHHRMWRWHRAYGGGQIMDWIGHHNDIAQWAIGMETGGPVRVEARRFTWPATGLYNTPVDYAIHCEYAGGIESVISSANPLGTKWIGEDGWVFVDRDKLEASDPAWLAPEFERGPWKAYDLRGHNHYGNFLDCVKTRQPAVATAEIGHRSITPGHLAYVSATLGRALPWDPAKEEIPGDEEAMRLLTAVNYRAPWAEERRGRRRFRSDDLRKRTSMVRWDGSPVAAHCASSHQPRSFRLAGSRAGSFVHGEGFPTAGPFLTRPSIRFPIHRRGTQLLADPVRNLTRTEGLTNGDDNRTAIELHVQEVLWLCVPALLIGLVVRLMFLTATPESYYGPDSNSYFNTARAAWVDHDLSFNSKRRFLYPLCLP